MGDHRNSLLLPLLLLLHGMSSQAGLTQKQLSDAAAATSEALRKEMMIGETILAKLQRAAAEGTLDLSSAAPYPAIHTVLYDTLAHQLMTAEGAGGVHAAYIGIEDGTMHGVRIAVDGSVWVSVGHPPSNTEIKCTDEKTRSTCRSPPGTVHGRVEVYRVSGPPASWELSELHQNMTYDPRLQQWYQKNDGPTWGHSFVTNWEGSPDHTLGITLSMGLRKKGGGWMGVAALDYDLSGLDTVLGPLRPAPGSEVILADVSDNTILSSTMPSLPTRLKSAKVSMWDPPYAKLFVVIYRFLDHRIRTNTYQRTLIHPDDLIAALIHWDAIVVEPVRMTGGLSWMLVITDDTDQRAAHGESAAGLRVTAALAALIVILSLLF